MAYVVNKDFVLVPTVACAIFEFITGDHLSTSNMNQEMTATFARYALNCPSNYNIVNMKRLNARPKDDAFDNFWGKMAELVEGRVNDRHHKDTLYMPAATIIPNLIEKTFERQPAPKAPILMWVTLQFCVKNSLSLSDINYIGD